MSRQTDHATLIATLTRELPEVSPYAIVELARKLRRAGTTLQRLAEAQCNGDWPADNGQRAVQECGACGQYWVGTTLVAQLPYAEDHTVATARDICQECRVQDRVRRLLKPYGCTAIFHGDPRGAILKVITPRYATLNQGKDRFNWDGVYVA